MHRQAEIAALHVAVLLQACAHRIDDPPALRALRAVHQDRNAICALRIRRARRAKRSEAAD
jgi:hypothetical protein